MNTTTSIPPIARYNGLAVVLHWALGLMLIGLFCLGVYMADLPFSPQRLKLFNWHKWVGILVLALSFLRLFWRLIRPAPALPSHIAQAMPAWQRVAHHGTHAVLYLLFFAVPLLGWAYSSATGFSIVLFGVLPLPDFVGKDAALAHTLKEAHEIGAYLMALFVLLHVAAALKHQWLDRDGLIGRMWFGRS
ncbi:cytochrome b [Hylemonella gracilis]|uniref:Cytochrome B561 n=1 Tax=Hylemonella gracilis ATCC 19624 TaxID=887062 RepID=F3KQH5_9BURK|nr:cytochrome b [Hylemonella gracilis]EGI77958.1 cytochrome B561 [Hylemonella gracilis ATCC 19624]